MASDPLACQPCQPIEDAVVFRIRPLSGRAVAVELSAAAANWTVATVRAAFGVLTPGEESAKVVECVALVTTCRSHGYWIFTDLDVEGERIQAVVEPSTLDQRGGVAPGGLALSLLTRPGSTIRLRGRPGRTRRGELSLFASSIELVGLPPQPAAVAKAAQLVAAGAMDAAVAADALRCDRAAFAAVVHAVEAAGGDGDEPQCRQAVRSCAAALSAGHHRRHRPQHFGRAQLEALGALHGAHAAWRAVPEAALFPWDAGALGTLDPERGLPRGLPAAERELRAAYIRQKKVPQLRWLLAQVARLLERRAAAGAPAARLLDLGCGRADLSLVAAASFPALRVLGVDCNPAAIESARQRAAAAGVPNAQFVVGNAAEWLRTAATDGLPPRVDVVTALHACGGLSDVALELAALCGASAVVCTCCFNKHRALCPPARWRVSQADQDLVCRVAESEQAEVAVIARETISGLRLAAVTRSLSQRAAPPPVSSVLKTFPRTYSPQNFVLVLELAPMASDDERDPSDCRTDAADLPDGYSELQSLSLLQGG